MHTLNTKPKNLFLKENKKSIMNIIEWFVFLGSHETKRIRVYGPLLDLLLHLALCFWNFRCSSSASTTYRIKH